MTLPIAPVFAPLPFRTLAAAILMPAGFFLSAAGRGGTPPNRLVVLLYVGMAVLGLGVAPLSVSLLTS